MQTTIIINGARDSEEVFHWFDRSVKAEKSRLEYDVRKTREKLELFENKYNNTSDNLGVTIFAEDLEGQDNEYVKW